MKDRVDLVRFKEIGLEQPPLHPEPTVVTSAVRNALTVVNKLGPMSAELFANEYIMQGLGSLAAGDNVLVLSDGRESKSAGAMAIDYSHLNIYSTDVDFPEEVERVEMFGIGYNRVKVDNTKPLHAELFGSQQTRFGAVLMLKGLCDHQKWTNRHGHSVGAVGCAGVRLNEQGISTLLAGIALLLDEKSRFALHGDINFMDRQAEHQALAADVQQAIVAGVERFNKACGANIANVWAGDTGLVIAGETTAPMTTGQRAVLESMVQHYFSADRAMSPEKSLTS